MTGHDQYRTAKNRDRVGRRPTPGRRDQHGRASRDHYGLGGVAVPPSSAGAGMRIRTIFLMYSIGLNRSPSSRRASDGAELVSTAATMRVARIRRMDFLRSARKPVVWLC